MLEQLVAEYQIRDGELTSSVPVTNERDLIISMLAYIKQDVGGERFVASADALSTFAARFPKRISLGGTSVRAALAMSRLGVPSTLHLASINDYMRRLLPPACDYICSAREDTLYPHLIVQYEQDIRVRVGDVNLHAPFPNRLIYVNDPPNEALVLSDELGSMLFDADIFLISGFNSMRDQDALDERLFTLRRHMRQLPSHALVYYEDAAFHEPAFSRRVRNALLEVIDVYGLNEDEMQAHLGSDRPAFRDRGGAGAQVTADAHSGTDPGRAHQVLVSGTWCRGERVRGGGSQWHGDGERSLLLRRGFHR